MNLWSSPSPSFLSFLLFSLLVLAPAKGHAGTHDFPESPDPVATPGDLCDKPDSYRYPERIPYCERDVDSRLKRDVAHYDQELGYEIQRVGRANFKIDHLIPLCMGGSNDEENLWPQHKSIYELTDPLEPALCEQMAAGRMRQAEAVALILQAKKDPRKAPALLKSLSRSGRR